ncbi:MAG: IS1595 family transposase [Gammaproteobacteria bacterium]|nr:IS1595 family transposase [Gammaproteobacteria bacterium]
MVLSFSCGGIVPQNWLLAMYMVVTARKGISSMQLSKELSITQRSAWFLLGRLREALGSDPGSEKLKGIVEVDELFHGGRERSKPLSKRTPGGAPKQLVLGLRERGGRSVAMPIDSRKKKIIQKKIAEHVEPGSEIHTDNLASYDDLPGYVRRHVNHHVEQYVGPGDIHCNSVESMWALLRRSIHGIWHHVSVKHLQRYISEATFRLNEGNVKIHTLARLDAFAVLAFRCRITYKKFIA